MAARYEFRLQSFSTESAKSGPRRRDWQPSDPENHPGAVKLRDGMVAPRWFASIQTRSGRPWVFMLRSSPIAPLAGPEVGAAGLLDIVVKVGQCGEDRFLGQLR